MSINAASDVERTVLGICLLEDESSQELVFSLLSKEHFYLDSHQRIFEAMRRLFGTRQPVNIVTLVQELNKANELVSVGGSAQLFDLTNGLPRRHSENSLRNYLERIKEYWRLRQLQLLAEETSLGAAESDAVASSLIETTAARMEAIVADSVDERASVADSIVATMDEFARRRTLQRSPGLRYGVPSLDSLTGGMMAGLQTAVGALPGIGKTTFMCQAILETLRAGHGADAFLYEPTKYQVTMQIISLMLNAPYGRITKPWTCPDDLNRAIMRAAGELAEMPLRMHDRAGMTLDEQLGLARLAIGRYNSRLICTDFIQRMKIKSVESNEGVRLKIARASRSLADLVKGTKAHSLLLSQIGTGRKSGAGSVPTMFDFNESGSIEQDARTILLLYREYDEREGHYGSKGAIFCAKQTFGAPGNVAINFDPVTAAWKDSSANAHPETWHDKEVSYV